MQISALLKGGNIRVGSARASLLSGLDAYRKHSGRNARFHLGSSPLEAISEHVDFDGSNHQGLLAEPALELGAIALPPRMVDVAGHDLEDEEIIATRPADFRPDALRRRARERRDASESLGEFAPHLSEILARESDAIVVSEGEQDLDEIHEPLL
jgi:hypothetical protein